jgi:hypothetical protein
MRQPTAEILLSISFRDIAKWVRSDPNGIIQILIRS